MNKMMTGVLAAALSLGLGAAIPAAASPLPSLQSVPAMTGERAMADVHQVQRRYYRSDRYYRDDHRYWRGHRGYRHQRPGYRYYEGYWFPPAAFIAGAIIGGAAIAGAAPRAPGGTYYYSPAHVEWCMARFRSYRGSDNSFQPFNGPRRQCRSPYM